MLFYFALLFSVLVVVSHIYYRYSRGGRLINRIAGPKPMFFFGNVWDICLTPEQIFTSQIKWRKQYGDFWKLCGFNYRAIFVYKAEDIETILSSTKYNNKNYPYIFLYSWLREGLLTSIGEKWQHRRKMLTPAFHFLILKKFHVTMCEHTEDLMQYLGAEVGRNQTDLMPLISKQTLRVICETSMGINIRENDKTSITNKYFDALQLLSTCLVYRVIRLWLFNDFTYSLTSVSKVEKKALKDLHGFTTDVIQERRRLRENNNVSHNNSSFHRVHNNEADEMYGNKMKMAMLDLLLDEEKKGNIDEAGIREEVDTFTFEGHDTTATALCFMIMRIANETEIQNSIYEELRGIFGDSQRMPTFEDLTQMKYLECCIKESLRLYPSVPFMARHLTEETDIGGHKVPKNTFCNINVFDIHRNPAVFPEPEKFNPDRFLPENMNKIHPYAYIPFSAGPRNCIGQKFAMMEMKTVISSLLWRYEVEPVTRPEDLTFKIDIVLRTNHPIYVRFLNRNNNVGNIMK